MAHGINSHPDLVNFLHVVVPAGHGRQLLGQKLQRVAQGAEHTQSGRIYHFMDRHQLRVCRGLPRIVVFIGFGRIKPGRYEQLTALGVTGRGSRHQVGCG